MGPLKVLCLALVLGAATAMEAWKEELLKQENGHRADHSAAPMTYNPTLEKGAQEWAEVLTSECGGLHHAPADRKESPSLYSIEDKQQGENIQFYGNIGDNIHYGEEGPKGALTSADAWYREIEDYPWGDFDGKDNPKMIFHFSQMVWQGTKQVGYGMSTCNTTYHDKSSEFDGKPMIKVFTVARYFPGGNLIGAFKENVKPKH